MTHATTFDNPHLPDVQKERLEHLEQMYRGTNIGWQELLGQIVEDVPGAIWSCQEIDADRVTGHPDLAKVRGGG